MVRANETKHFSKVKIKLVLKNNFFNINFYVFLHSNLKISHISTQILC